jgi:hypothetical protein
MANIQAGDRVMVTFHSLLFSQEILSTFCYGLSAITGTNSQSSAFDRLHAALTAAGNLADKYRAVCAPQLNLTEIWYQVISPSRYAKYVRTSGLGVGTLGDGEYKTANMAAVILRRGDFGNRHNVSTLHVPIGQTSGEVASGQIGADIEGPLNALATQVKAAVTTTTVVASWDPVINNGPNAPDYIPITDTQVKTVVRTMRRRNIGKGV